MSTYTAFEEQFLVAAYELTEEKDQELVTVREILDAFNLDAKPHWIERAVTSLIDDSYSRDIRHIGPAIDQRIYLTSMGVREAERLVNEGVKPSRQKPTSTESNLPDGITEITGGRIFASEGPVPTDFEGREGDIHLELLPASDRMVPINHNQPEYQAIKRGIDELYDEFRSANDLPIGGEERDRVLSSLAAARSLWDAAQLKIIQIKVGIIMAVDDAVSILEKVGKATRQALLIGAIKAFIKHTTGIDL